MDHLTLKRRQFLQAAAAGAGLCIGARTFAAAPEAGLGPSLISPGSIRSKVRVAKVYLGRPQAHWPNPAMDLDGERARYEAEFAKRSSEFADVDFTVDELVTTAESAQAVAGRIGDVDGVLLIHLSMGVSQMLPPILATGKPALLFAAPYSGHEWTQFGQLRRQEEGARLECVLSGDFDELAVAMRPFRAIHHLREAVILNVSTRDNEAYAGEVRQRFGTEIRPLTREKVLAAYEAVDEAAAVAEAERWIGAAQAVVEPVRDEIVRSCRLALAFERVLAEEGATTITVDCYGTMYRQLPAFPCIGFTRLNDMGLAGICESDLRSAMTFILLQGLTGRPGFISDPTVDEGEDAIILAHCLGSTRMLGPAGPASPYKIRSIMEREEGAVTQVFMPVGEPVIQAILASTDRLQYFTGQVVAAPDTDRGCRSKISVRVDGDLRVLWQNWSEGLHRVTCYGDHLRDLERFCRYTGIRMMDEARPATPA